VLASSLLIESKGLIVNISSAGGQNYLFNVSYGVTKCAVDRLAVDMGRDLKVNCDFLFSTV
jgi:dehydrogenase/reductase SDR family protein 1